MTVELTRRGLLGLGAAGLLGACSRGSARRRPGVRNPNTASGAHKPLVVGCVAPFTGPDAAVGDRVKASLSAALAHIDADLGGSFLGFHPTVIRADAPLTGADGVKAYRDLVAQKVDAILWCGSPGLEETVPDIVRDLLPVIAVATDLQGRAPFNSQIPDLGTAAASSFPVFQTAVPDTAAIDLLLRYVRQDRGFDRAALLFSTSSHPLYDVYWDAACKHWGVGNAGAVDFDSANGTADLMPPVQALRGTNAQAVVIMASAREAGAAAVALDGIGARYVDATTAHGPGFHPMVLGGPRAVGDALFARAAAGHASVGSVSVGTFVEFPGFPAFPMRDWIRRFRPETDGGAMIGGEEGPADGLAAIVAAAANASSIDGADIIAALENGIEVAFASAVPFTFAADRHLASTGDDLVLTTLEVPPGGPYNLGQEWAKGYLPPGFVGPDLLPDFTLEANRKAQPAVVAALLDARLGTSARPEYQGSDPGRVAACRAVH